MWIGIKTSGLNCQRLRKRKWVVATDPIAAFTFGFIKRLVGISRCNTPGVRVITIKVGRWTLR